MTDEAGSGDEPDPAEESLYARESSGVGLVVVLAIVALLVIVVIGGAGSPPGTSADRPAATAEAALPDPTTATTSTTTSTTSTSTSTTSTSTSTTSTSTTSTSTVPAPATVSAADIDAAVAGYLAARLPGWTITYLGPRPDITGWADPTSRILYVYVRPDRSVADHAAVIRHQIDVIAASGS